MTGKIPRNIKLEVFNKEGTNSHIAGNVARLLPVLDIRICCLLTFAIYIQPSAQP